MTYCLEKDKKRQYISQTNKFPIKIILLTPKASVKCSHSYDYQRMRDNYSCGDWILLSERSEIKGNINDPVSGMVADK